MSTPRHHAEWLSLVEVSGPFLSMPVLLRVFPQGLDAHDPDHARNLRLAHEEWEDDQGGLRPDPAIHRAWIRFILTQTLGFEADLIAEGQGLPPGLEALIAEHGETLRPDLAVVAPPGLPDGGKPRLLFQVYAAEQGLERAVDGRLWKASPATRMMELLHATGVPLGLVTNGEHWMLVYAPRGETTGFASWYAALWLEEPLTLRALRTLLSAHRFFGVADDDTLEALLRASSQEQQEVTEQLGYQVRKAVEVLVQAIDRIDRDRDRELLRGADEKRLYEAALTVMMRLVFLFSAEERGLLLLGDPVYDQHYAVSTLRAQLREGADQHGEEVLERRHDAWSRLLATFRAVYAGVTHERLSVPPYGGTLFDPDRFPFLEGREADTSWEKAPTRPLPIHNRTVLHLLEALQVLQVKVPGGGPAEARRLSFRALDIEQIGHVYEGLLDHTAVRADGPVLGLAGTRDSEPEIALEKLEEERAKGEAVLLAFLKDETGRSESALRNALNGNPSGAGRRARKAGTGSGLFGTQEGQSARPNLRAACENDAPLYERVLPFAGLLREDTQGCPVVFTDGSVYVTQGSDRRTTGTHYTPRILTETIVQHTLDPLVYRGPADGKLKEAWELRSAREILDLKVCDPAMGSGAFLVQACRYLSERLVEAWELELNRQDAKIVKPGEHAVEATQCIASVDQLPRPGGESGPVFLKPSGEITDEAAPPNRPLPADAEERLALARRIVADHCLYGVDKNAMAVEMAKLSLWLITLAKGKPFTFLDHRLRHGDSLVGTIWREPKPGKFLPLPDQIPDAAYRSRELREQNDRERQGQLSTGGAYEPPADDAGAYRKLAEFPDDPEGQKQKAEHYRRLRDHTRFRKRRLGADLWCSAWFWPYQSDLGAYAPTTGLYRAVLERGKEPPPEVEAEVKRLRERIPFFHWALEFPDVYAHGGFDAVAANPPFQGGQKITGALGTDYRDYLVEGLANGQRGSADLSAYFFLRAGRLIRDSGGFGMLATNTIAQGDTREVGLEQLTAGAWTIVRAVPSQPWPGAANLEVAVVWLRRGAWNGDRVLVSPVPVMDRLFQHAGRMNGCLAETSVPAITPFLAPPGTVTGKPYRLKANEGKSFQGSIVLGMGFVLTPDQALSMMQRDGRNRDVVSPYLGGEDLNSRPDLSLPRWVINFRDWPLNRDAEGRWKSADVNRRSAWMRSGSVPNDYPDPVATDYPDSLAIVREKVKPERDGQKDPGAKAYWWRFLRPRPELYQHIAPLPRAIALCLVNNHLGFAFCPTNIVFSHKTVVFPITTWGSFATLQSHIHYHWAWQFSSTMRRDINYSPSDCFETFALPGGAAGLDGIGERYYEHRQHLMLARREGLTKTYNRFHNRQEAAEDIRRLRELHVEMDHAVAVAYSWTDLDLGHGFHDTKQGVRYTISEAARREVLGRLLKLNHERYAEEVAQGLHEKGKGKSRANRGGLKGAEAGLTSGRRDLFDTQLSLGEVGE